MLNVEKELENIASQPCYIHLTNRALSDLKVMAHHIKVQAHNKTENLIRFLLSSQTTFLVHLEKEKGRTEDDLYINIHFDAKNNKELNQLIENRTFSLCCVLKNDGLLITSIKLLPLGVGQTNNRRLTTFMHFFINEKSTVSLKDELIASIKELPFGKEQSKFVKSRLESWEVYLDMMVDKAEKDEVKINYQSVKFTEHLREINIQVHALKRCIGSRNLRGAEVSLISHTENKEETQEKIGTVRRFDFDKNIVQVELDEDYVGLARKNKWNPLKSGLVHISNYGSLAQAKRLRSGFKDLQNGMATNPNLEYLLFEENPVIDTSNNIQSFQFKEAIQKNLNPYQRAAVQGALAAEDIYLIQGPPGTGKTTVIAEICYQNAERGLKTLIASQSNLAVDNALSKLLVHPKIRILRKGRTKSIEEEGKKFIEENVAHTWKQQTLENIHLDIEEINDLIKDSNREIQAIKKMLKENENKLLSFEKASLFKKKLTTLKKELKEKQHKVNELEKIRQQQIADKVSLEREIEQQTSNINELQHVLAHWDKSNPYEATKNNLQKRITQLNLEIQYLEAQSSAKQTTTTLDRLESDLHTLQIEKQNSLENLSEVTQQDEISIVSFIENNRKITCPEIMHKKAQLLELLRLKQNGVYSNYDLKEQLETFLELKSKLLLVIERQKKILEHYSYDIELVEILVKNEQYTDEQIKNLVPYLANQMITFIKPTLLENVTWKWSKKLPKKIEEIVEEYKQSLTVESCINEKIRQLKIKVLDVKESEKTIPRFVTELKQLLTTYSHEKIDTIQKNIEQIFIKQAETKNDLNAYDQSIKTLKQQLNYQEPLKKIEELRRQKHETEHQLMYMGSSEVFKEKHTLQIKKKLSECESLKSELKQIIFKLDQTKEKLKTLPASLSSLKRQIEQVQKTVNEFGSLDIEKGELNLTSKNNTFQKQISKIEKNIANYEKQLMMKKEWARMLKEAKDLDLNEIKKLYIKHANVIGITCVQSAKRDFAQDYPDFDVVIIDEVSKATPPELLLPMLKGKKIILVGDHHQLPPLIGQETIEEVVENISDETKKSEVQKNLKESLFERLFKTLPDKYKSTLRIQYRMHEDIMDAITQFYEDENEAGSGLICGLQHSDKERDHLLDGQYIKRGQHIMWFDLPNEEAFFEHKENGMTSPYNEAELKLIAGLLEDLNKAVMQAKQDGRILKNMIKNVGIISFYGEQVRRLKHLVDTMNLEHLQFRIGTVDRFQGMESDIIFASFVRNHNNIAEDIGFANDYRRLNVALSRAKELLIVTGSAKMFTVKAKRSSSRRMYKKVIDVVQSKNGFRDHHGRMK